ncbi:HIT domain-containing protein [Candidatus Gottesmanbacteria bacterium]|nr:HIT domain-containing protein [Candidatus Gottesmanbacteria bacterium]
MDCIFCKIGNREIPKEFTLETREVMVFPDIHPVAPVHLLIVSKKHIGEFTKAEDAILGQMLKITKDLIKKYKLETSGYRIVTNGGGAQLIDHFHIHLMGGINRERKL